MPKQSGTFTIPPITKLMLSKNFWGQTYSKFLGVQVERSLKKYLSSHVLCQAVEQQ